MAQNDKVVELNNPVKDPLIALLNTGARELLTKAVRNTTTTNLLCDLQMNLHEQKKYLQSSYLPQLNAIYQKRI